MNETPHVSTKYLQDVLNGYNMEIHYNMEIKLCYNVRSKRKKMVFPNTQILYWNSFLKWAPKKNKASRVEVDKLDLDLVANWAAAEKALSAWALVGGIENREAYSFFVFLIVFDVVFN